MPLAVFIDHVSPRLTLKGTESKFMASSTETLHTLRSHMAAAVVVRMHAMRREGVASSPQLAMSENCGDGVCIEHASRCEGHIGACHIQQACPPQCFHFLSVVIADVAPESLLIPSAVNPQC